MEPLRVFARKTAFVFHEAMLGLTRGRWMTGIVITTMVVALTMLGGFWLLFEDLRGLTRKVGAELQVVAFLQDHAAPQPALLEVQRLPGVARVELITKEDAWRQLRQDMSGKASLDEVMTSNPLPDTLQIYVTVPQAARQVVDELKKMPGIEEVKYSQDLVDRLQDMGRLVRLVGLAVSTVLGLATLAIVVNTIRLTVINRSNEIAIMQLVGASGWYIRWPFLLEGMLIGLISALGAIGLLVAWRIFTLDKVQAAFSFLPLSGDLTGLWRVAIGLVPIGVLLGCFGSLISVHQFLRISPSK